MRRSGSLIAVGFIAAAMGLAGCQNLGTAHEILSLTNSAVLAGSTQHTKLVPYLDLTGTQPGDTRADLLAAHVRAVVAGPVTGASGMCTPMWGNSAADDLLGRRNLRAILDSGGAVRLALYDGADEAVDSLAQQCATPGQLASALARAVREASAPGRQAALDIQAGTGGPGADVGTLVAALLALQRDADSFGMDPVAVGITMAADPLGGFGPNGDAWLAALLAGGIELSSVTADAHSAGAVAPRDGDRDVDRISGLGVAAVATACRAHDDLQRSYRAAGMDLSDKKAWGLLGLRISIGEQRATAANPHPVLSLADAADVTEMVGDLATEGTPLGLLSLWTLNRDHRCNYSGIARDELTGQAWAEPQSRCNLAGTDLAFTRALGGI